MKYFDDFQVGDKIVTRARTITEADIVNFAAFSGDWFPLHVDVEYAKKTQFGERIAHGMLVLSATTGLWPLYDMAIVAFYGIDKLRFLEPTKIGDTLHVELVVAEKQDKGERGGVISWNWSAKNQKDESVAVCIWKALLSKRQTRS